MILVRLLLGWFRRFSLGSVALLLLASSRAVAADPTLSSIGSDTVSKATLYGSAVATLAAVVFGLILLGFIAVFIIGLVSNKD